MKFKVSNGKQVFLKGMNTYPNQLDSSHNMRYILIHEDISWAAECFIVVQGLSIDISKHPEDIKVLLKK